jgi:hypothetical protein
MVAVSLSRLVPALRQAIGHVFFLEVSLVQEHIARNAIHLQGGAFAPLALGIHR